MILEWQLALTGHVEARLERAGHNVTQLGRAAVIGQRAEQVEAEHGILTSAPAFGETRPALGKRAARRHILGFKADDRAWRNRRAQRG